MGGRYGGGKPPLVKIEGKYAGYSLLGSSLLGQLVGKDL